MVANGFLSFDFIQNRYWCLDRNSLNFQTDIHHVVAICGFTASIFAGYGFAGISNASMLAETSSIFLSYKDMFTRESRNTPLG